MKFMKISKPAFIFYILLFVNTLLAQDQGLMQILEQEVGDTTFFAQASFKTNRIVLTQSIETRKKGTMEFVLGTRYWNIPNNDNSQSFGADRFSGHLGVQYAFTDRFTAGMGIATADGILNSFLKYRLIRQKQDGTVPFGVTLLQGSSYFSRDAGIFALPENTSQRWSYVSQVLIARKFNNNFSLQLSPTYFRMGSEQPVNGEQNLFLLGTGARYKLSNHVSLTSEYGLLFNRNKGGTEGFDLFGLGVNWEMGDLIMQFSMTNSKSFDDISIYSFNPNNFHFRPGGLHVGVNATYVLHFKKQKPNRK